MADKKYYKANTQKRVITIDTTVKATAEDKDIIQMYLAAGYTLRCKSQKRAAVARERAKKNGFGKKQDNE